MPLCYKYVHSNPEARKGFVYGPRLSQTQEIVFRFYLTVLVF